MYSGIEHGATFSQNYHTSSSTIFQGEMLLFIKYYIETQMDPSCRRYMQMQLRANYSTMSIHLVASHTRTVNF